MTNIHIAIDGPAGAGKSTVAKLLSEKLNLIYLDTGAMYRAVGLKVKNNNIDHLDEKSMADMLADTDIDFVNGDIILDGIIVNKEIRANDMSMMASKVSALPAVRAKLVELQRKMGQTKSIIMDGRLMKENLTLTKISDELITEAVQKVNAKSHKEILLMTIDANGNIFIQPKNGGCLSYTSDFTGDGNW